MEADDRVGEDREELVDEEAVGMIHATTLIS
jgi:hypothetical protein